jgi:hypothetical protein
LTLTKFLLVIIFIAIGLVSNPKEAFSGQLATRLEQYPNWNSKPSLQIAQGDLEYPDWIEGTWKVTSILVDLVAPLAPGYVTPGFEGNYRYLEKPIQFSVRFERKLFFISTQFPTISLVKGKLPVVADRAFNGLAIAQAYLGNDAVFSVKVDPNNPNRQITLLANERQLISTITARESETPEPKEFISTEITQQIFRSESQIYFNEVETTTAYQLLESGDIEANQITAIYLSPQDPNYFKTNEHPVALYRYHLQLARSTS